MLFTKIFWGGLIVLFGLSIIINAVFKINFPFFKVFVSLVIIYIGFKMLFGGFGFKMNNNGEENSTVFSSTRIQVEKIDGNLEFNSVFGSQILDFRNVTSIADEAEIEISAVFGGVKVYLPENVTLKMKANSAFGSVKSPNGEVTNFGEARKTISKGGEHEKTVYLEVNAVFGSVDMR